MRGAHRWSMCCSAACTRLLAASLEVSCALSGSGGLTSAGAAGAELGAGAGAAAGSLAASTASAPLSLGSSTAMRSS